MSHLGTKPTGCGRADLDDWGLPTRRRSVSRTFLRRNDPDRFGGSALSLPLRTGTPRRRQRDFSHCGGKGSYIFLKPLFGYRYLDSAGWRFVAVVGYLMLIFSCIPTFWQTKISICRSAHSLFVSLRCIHCALLCKSYVCWHSCRCFKTPLSQSGRALVSSDSQSSPTSHTSVSHTIAVKLLPQRVAGHHRSYSSPTEPDR